jgi:hypothetical protein
VSGLPGIAGEIAEEIGETLTVKLLRERGGLRISLPQRARGSDLAGIIGVEATERLIARLGNGVVTLPTGGVRGAGGRKARAMQLLQDGWSIEAVARQLDLHRRTVENYSAELRRGDDRQGRLPL